MSRVSRKTESKERLPIRSLWPSTEHNPRSPFHTLSLLPKNNPSVCPQRWVMAPLPAGTLSLGGRGRLCRKKELMHSDPMLWVMQESAPEDHSSLWLYHLPVKSLRSAPSQLLGHLCVTATCAVQPAFPLLSSLSVFHISSSDFIHSSCFAIICPFSLPHR